MKLTLHVQGNERWVEALDHDFHKEFIEAETEPWVTNDSEMVAGTVRSAGYVTFVTVYDAGSVILHQDKIP